MLNTPVLLIIFNRPETTKKVFEVIRTVKPTKIFIAADGPRKSVSNDEENCHQARDIVSLIDWPCEINTLFQEKNLGCSLAPRAAFDWFFSHEPEGIILEDDCLADVSFFNYCSILLEKYRDDERIISINGSNLGYELSDGNSYTFSRFMNMWGWATWKRSADIIDYEVKEWLTIKKPLQKLYQVLRQNIFDSDINWYKYWKDKFDKTVNNKDKTWWDWQWIYYQIMNKKYSIVPSVNLVTNIGFNEEATHTKEYNNPASGIKNNKIEFPLIHPSKMSPDILYEEKFVKWVWCYHKRLPTTFYIKSILKKSLKANLAK